MLNKSNIEEANRHLQALHERVHELEHAIKEQHEALLAKDSFIQTKIQELVQQDDVIRAQKESIKLKDDVLLQRDKTIMFLEKSVQVKDSKINALEERNEGLTRLLSFLPGLKSIVSKMEKVAINIDAESMATDTDSVQSSPVSAVDGNTVDALKHSQSGDAMVNDFTPTITQTDKPYAKGHFQKYSISDGESDEDHEITNLSVHGTPKELYL